MDKLRDRNTGYWEGRKKGGREEKALVWFGIFKYRI